ncbi:hypothetical protein NEOLEDRAFT_1156120 [Neolentinus lepideus HHB14362 ss-1]|uniref:Nuclear pore complex protein NUP96 C-terminal domain-containing protein n=1 Tax=Neolentinus lepideus HHB14362 ss-1 TaxID=1314782 RepID=A0A165SU54_9AGAM|nr:hypothetical protein NEOLEDRAFT_1156120 [Neolentinus lepideus HHB14362 ss-1]
MARFTPYASDSDDDAQQPTPSSSLRQSTGGKSIRPPADDESSSDQEQDSSPAQPQPAPERPQPSPTKQRARPPQRGLTPWARTVGVDPKRMEVMQAVFFALPKEQEEMRHLAASEMQKQVPRPPRPSLAKSLAVSRKHSRESERDQHRSSAHERTSFENPMAPMSARPIRKFARMSTTKTTSMGKEHLHVDAGLALGRSFRVSWGPGGKLAHIGTLCSPFTPTKTTIDLSSVSVTSLRIQPGPLHLYQLFLQHHLNSSIIQLDVSDVPVAIPAPSSKMTFSSFLPLFAALPGSGPFEESLFRLGHALFDDLDLKLSDKVPSDVRYRILALRRKLALSKWLRSTVASSVEKELRERPSLDDSMKAFLHMTGNQIDKACEVSMSGGYTKLATLIAQAGGDEDFRADLLQQLEAWKDEKVEGMIEDGVKKVYALLAGALGEEGVWKDLDWKRAFGLCLWFGQKGEAGISEAFNEYTEAFQGAEEGAGMVPPMPWYLESEGVKSSWKMRKLADPPDALYSMIKLFVEPTCSLAQVLAPLSFSPSPLDYALCWHLYIIMSRSMRIRDFPDRSRPPRRHTLDDDDDDEETEEEEEPIEGHSPSADLLTNMYALQLESTGRLEPAIFVLMHIEGSAGREKAIKELLLRSAPLLNDWAAKALIGKLKVPLTWINEAKAIHALSIGKVWDAYELYRGALLYERAHDVAVQYLAPEACVRGDLDLVKGLFQGMEGKVGWWTLHGKIFVDYADIMITLPGLLSEVQAEPDADPDPAQKTAIEEMSLLIPRLIGLLPDILSDRADPRHRAALTHMTGKLTILLGRIKVAGLTKVSVQLKAENEGARLEYLHATIYEKFLDNMRTAVYA